MLLFLTGYVPAAIRARTRENPNTAQSSPSWAGLLLITGANITTAYFLGLNVINVFRSLEPSHPANWGLYWLLVVPQVGVKFAAASIDHLTTQF